MESQAAKANRGIAVGNIWLDAIVVGIKKLFSLFRCYSEQQMSFDLLVLLVVEDTLGNARDLHIAINLGK